MEFRSIKKTALGCVMFIAILGLCSWEFNENVSVQEANSLVVIANIDGVTEISFKELKSIMRGERQRWKGGTKVELALMKTTTSIGGLTAEKIYNMSSNQLNKYWLAQVFQGRVHTPQFFTSESELLNFVNETPGAIGVVSVNRGAKQYLKIDGKSSL